MTQNGYCEITILGRKAGLKFNMYAIEQLNAIKGNSGTIKNSTAIVWAGLLGNAYVKQTEPAFSFEEVNEWVEEQWLSNDAEGHLSRISEVFTNAQVLTRLQERAKGNGEPETKDQKKRIAKAV